MRALVTGAFGFAGWHLVRHLRDRGDTVLGTHLEPEAGHHLCDGAMLDITDLAACQLLIERYRPDTIYHLAGVSFGPDAERDFAVGLAVNVGGFFNVVRAAAQLPKPVVVVLISSAEVYGAVPTDQLPISEQIPPGPVNNYGLTKLLAEQVFSRFEKFSDLRPVVIRAFNHIGAGQRPDFMVPNFAQQLARIARGKALPTMLVGNLEACRDFSDVGDIVQGYRLAAEKGRGVYNLCSGKSVRVRDVLDQLVAISGQSVEIKEDPSRLRPSDIPEVRGNFEKASRELGWPGPTVSLESSLRRVYEYWFEREK